MILVEINCAYNDPHVLARVEEIDASVSADSLDVLSLASDQQTLSVHYWNHGPQNTLLFC